jgi:hypothetical protein
MKFIFVISFINIAIINNCKLIDNEQNKLKIPLKNGLTCQLFVYSFIEIFGFL